MTVTTATAVRAADLSADDVFVYGGERQRVLGTTVVGAVAGGDLIEVATIGVESGDERWIDYAASETVAVIDGPSAEKPAPVVAPKRATTATQRAREAVRAGKVRSLPASAALVLYALAAAQDEAEDKVWVPNVGSIATGAGLAVSTTQGHLRALAAKGLAREAGPLQGGWVVA